MTIKVKGYNKSKYDETSKKLYEYELENVVGFKVVLGEENVPMKIIKSWEDDEHEYLMIYFEDGTFNVWQNSRVDIFRMD